MHVVKLREVYELTDIIWRRTSWEKRMFQLLLLAFCSRLVSGGEVLIWQDTGSKSHMFALQPLAMALADRGHKVVYVSKYGDRAMENHGNIELIHVGSVQKKKKISKAIFEGAANDWEDFAQMAIDGQNASLSHPRVRELLREEAKFDVVVVSFFCMNLGLYAAHNIFKAPTVIFSPGTYLPHIDMAMGNPVNPSHIPVGITDLGSHMSFVQRLENTLALTFLTLFFRFHMLPKVNVALKEQLRLDHMPDLLAEVEKVSAAMYNTHAIFDAVKPHNPNTVLVGGIHIKEANLDNIDKDVKLWMDEAEHGVIVVAFGSILSADEMPESKLVAMLSVFSRLKQRVVWKWESDAMPNKPDNLLIRKWLPQQDILGHPKVRLFVTHGGLLGNEEAVFHGIPMVAIPGFGDQFSNAKRVTRLGFGLDLSWPTLTEQTFGEAINSVLNNAHFKERAVKYSDIFRDEPLKAIEKATFHVEHIMRHKGIQHLRPASLDLVWYEYFLIDVALLLIFGPCFTMYIVIRLLKRLCTKDLAKKKLEKARNSKKGSKKRD